MDLPGAPAHEERKRLEPLINDLLDRLIAGLKDNATRAWVVDQMEPTVAKFYLEDTEARERCVVYLDRIFSILRLPGPEGAFQKYMLDWRTPLRANRSLPPSLRLHVDGAADPFIVRVEYMLAGPFGGYRTQLRGSSNYVDIPIVVEGQSARSLRAIVFCPGYHTVLVDIPDVAAQTELRVVMDALAVRRLVGRVEFVAGANPRSFVLDIDVRVPSSHKFFGIADGAVTTFQVSEAVVSAEGDFSVVMADLAQDERLQSPGQPSVFWFHARDAATGNFVFDLMPSEIAIDDLPEELMLSASPTP